MPYICSFTSLFGHLENLWNSLYVPEVLVAVEDTAEQKLEKVTALIIFPLEKTDNGQVDK